MIATPKISNENNIKEVRGWIIDCLNGVEMFVDKIIIDFFKPENIEDFKKIILNASIMNFGAKIKILSNIDYISNKIIEKIRKLSAIRNGFAHAHSKNILKIIHDPKKEPATKVESYKGIEVMNSSGKVEIKNFLDYYNEFKEMFEETKVMLTELFQAKGLTIL
ncbi:hypothetical protein AB670_01515 [Chryseobacterium sp. MOF25P]|uniref:Uncharacterized protein n=1 Tax=Chryseobacterium piscium TaxID=333702 RepID=A0A3D9BGV1_9FLAO|nr:MULTISPECIES: hypothetical protein [Chryseobacterium]OBW42095.1 hypothetical protein AB670_01515 [Chryseobacterium sp. MOF25P]OBW45460.1 hypothetical protein AB671_02420 [Chryseobacterium sp. BGARF1]REC52760.1 hypothetical protein DRF62_15015 [Chryseobacterium piscium]